jgi:CHAT domain-containing protein
MSMSGESRPFSSGAALAFFLLSTLVFHTPSNAATDPIPLEVGQTVSIEMYADQSPEFSAHLETGKAYLFRVEEGGFEIKVEVREPTGKSQTFDFPTYRDYPTHRDERELLLIEADESGQYIFTVSTEDYTGAIGHPHITVSPIDPGNSLIQAYRLMNEAASLYARSDWKAALDKLLEVEPLLAERSAAALLGRCLMGIAILYYWEGSDYYVKGLAYFERTEMAYRESGEELLATSALQLQASIRVDMAYEIEKTPSLGLAPEAVALFDEAIALFKRVLAVQRDHRKRFEAAATLNLIGYAYWMMGDYDHAIEYYTFAAAEYRELEEWDALPWPLNNVAVIDFDRGYLVSARDSFQENLDSLPAHVAVSQRAFWLDNLGSAYLELGQLDKALKSFSSALEMHRQAADEAHEVDSIQGIGDTYLAFGENELGMEYLEAALPLFRKHSFGPGLVSLLNSLGRQYLELGKHDEALAAHREAEEAAVNPRNRAYTLLYLSDALAATGKPEKALELLNDAAQIAQNMDLRMLQAEVLQTQGEALHSAARYRDALEAFHSANTSFEELGLAIEQSQTLHGMARSLASLSEPEASAQYAVRAIAAVENHRAGLSTPQLRAFFMARRQEYYIHLIGTLAELQKSAPPGDYTHLLKALNYSERSRARSLADLINETTQMGATNSRNEEKDALHNALAEARYRLQGRTRQKLSENELNATRQQLSEIENRLNLLEIELRESNQAYANLVDPTILGAEEIQNMLNPERALLQYALGRERGFAFLVTNESVQSWPLPGKAAIERDARILYEQLRIPPRSREDQNRLNKLIAAFAETVLPPAAALRQSQLLVVADGVLQYLPFSLLLATNGEWETDRSQNPFEVVNVPSMSVLAGQRKNGGERNQPSRTIAIFADPVFSTEDRRVSGTPVSGSGIDAAIVSRQLSTLVEPRDLKRLPATAYEAETIAGLVNPDQRSVQTGFDANREFLLTANLADFRIVHFATHGKIDSRYPALSWLAFSQIDQNGMEQNGLIRLYDIYNLDLNAELVTMSACDTALGREISGEGLTGLVQGFMYSGARSVLASLWQVPDRATAELMRHFYRYLFQQEQKPAEALRNAQLALSSNPRWRHPYFWSAFVLQGDWE